MRLAATALILQRKLYSITIVAGIRVINVEHMC